MYLYMLTFFVRYLLRFSYIHTNRHTHTHAALDTVCCFLLKQTLACTIPNVTAMIQVCVCVCVCVYGHTTSEYTHTCTHTHTHTHTQQLYGSKGLSLSQEDLGRLCAVAPQAVALHYAPANERGECVCVCVCARIYIH